MRAQTEVKLNNLFRSVRTQTEVKTEANNLFRSVRTQTEVRVQTEVNTQIEVNTLSAKTIIVSKTGSTQSIKKAIELAQPGDTIIVKSGIYREGNIILEKSIVLLGENFPILDGESKVEIMTIHTSNAVISGFKFRDTGIASINDLAAIKILDSKYLRIHNNQFENTFFWNLPGQLRSHLDRK